MNMNLLKPGLDLELLLEAEPLPKDEPKLAWDYSSPPTSLFIVYTKH